VFPSPSALTEDAVEGAALGTATPARSYKCAEREGRELISCSMMMGARHCSNNYSRDACIVYVIAHD